MSVSEVVQGVVGDLTAHASPDYKPENVVSNEPGYSTDILPNIEETQERHIALSLPDNHFVSQYVRWGQSVTDGFVEYHIVNALWLLSAATSRKVVLKLKQEYVRPNLWIMTVGNSTTSRKSTTVNKTREIFESATNIRLPNSDYSLEGYLEALSETPIMHNVRDEAAGLLAKFHKKYNDGIFAFECSIYDGSPRILEKRLASGRAKTPKTYTIQDYYVTKLYATTPSKLAQYMEMGDFTSGYGYRWLYNYPKYKHARKPYEMEDKEDVEAWTEVIRRVRDFHNLFKTGDEVVFKASPDTMNYFDGICQEMETKADAQNSDVLDSIIGRSEIHILKIAMLLELGKTPVSTTLSNDTIQQAADLVLEYFIPSILEVIDRLEEDTKFNQIEKIIGILRRLGGKGTHTKLLRDSHMKSREFNECIETMIESQRIRVCQEKPQIFQLINHNNLMDFRKVRKVRNVRTFATEPKNRANFAKTTTGDTKPLNPSVAGKSLTTCCERANSANFANFANKNGNSQREIMESALNLISEHYGNQPVSSEGIETEAHNLSQKLQIPQEQAQEYIKRAVSDKYGGVVQ